MAYGSVYLTESALIKTGPGELHAVLITGGADAATVTLYNNTAGSGTILCKVDAGILTTAPMVSFPGGIAFSTGLYAVITGTTPSVTVEFL